MEELTAFEKDVTWFKTAKPWYCRCPPDPGADTVPLKGVRQPLLHCLQVVSTTCASKKLSKPSFLSVQLAVNVLGELCSADLSRAVIFPSELPNLLGDCCYGDELVQQLLRFSLYLYLEEWGWTGVGSRWGTLSLCGCLVVCVWWRLRGRWGLCLSPVTQVRREQMVPCTATLMLTWAFCSSGQHQAGLLQRARNCPHASPSLQHAGNSETVKLLPGVFASHYSTQC